MTEPSLGIGLAVEILLDRRAVADESRIVDLDLTDELVAESGVDLHRRLIAGEQDEGLRMARFKDASTGLAVHEPTHPGAVPFLTVSVVGHDESPHVIAVDGVLGSHAAIVDDQGGHDDQEPGFAFNAEVGTQGGRSILRHVEVVAVEPGLGGPRIAVAAFALVACRVEICDPGLELQVELPGVWAGPVIEVECTVETESIRRTWHE